MDIKNLPVVKYRVDEDEIEDIREYAKVKRQRKDANLARVALFYYMRKNPLVRKKK